VAESFPLPSPSSGRRRALRNRQVCCRAAL